MERKNRKKALLLLFKLAVSILFLYLVFRKAGAREVLSHLASANPLHFMASTGLYLLATLVSVRRWQLLLDEKYSVGRLFSLYMIGSFFNNVLPGIIGGDAVKAYYLYADSRRGDSSLGSVFMDRYIGYAALMAIGLLAGLAGYGELRQMGLHMVMPVLSLLFVMGSAVVFGLRIGSRFPQIDRFYVYFHRYARNGRVMTKTFMYSVIIQLITILMIYIIARGLGYRLALIPLLVFVPVIVTIATVPVSISGFGVREGAFVLLFGHAGLPPQAATSLSLLWFLSVAAASLIGLVEFLRYRKKSPDRQ